MKCVRLHKLEQNVIPMSFFWDLSFFGSFGRSPGFDPPESFFRCLQCFIVSSLFLRSPGFDRFQICVGGLLLLIVSICFWSSPGFDLFDLFVSEASRA